MRIRRSRESNSASATRGNDMNENTNEKLTDATLEAKNSWQKSKKLPGKAQSRGAKAQEAAVRLRCSKPLS